MINSARVFEAEMKKMIRLITEGKPYMSDPPTREELEVLTECINRGYLLSMTNSKESDVSRSLDGSPRPIANPNVVPLKGLSFLKPDRTERRSKAALIVSLCAAVISLMALIVGLLSNLDRIVENVELLQLLFSQG